MAADPDWLAPFLVGKTKLDDIGADDLASALDAALPWDLARRLDDEAPTHFQAPTGTAAPIDYEAEGGPAIALRVQELFGLNDASRARRRTHSAHPPFAVARPPPDPDHARPAGLLARLLGRRALRPSRPLSPPFLARGPRRRRADRAREAERNVVAGRVDHFVRSAVASPRWLSTSPRSIANSWAARMAAGAAFAMRLLVRFAEAVDARAFLDIEAAHVDGCLYHGRASLDFVERMVELGGKVRVPTTLNVGSVDLIHPELFRGTAEHAENGARLMRAHVELGCAPTFTCAPYQTLWRPRFGAQIAWGESNAIVFANSVIGARTNRYGDFIDLCCAMTGRAPAYGLHLTENRRAGRRRDRRDPGGLGQRAARGRGRPYRSAAAAAGLSRRSSACPPTMSEDDLKALGAAAASSGAVALFHAVGLTPEAPDLETACGGLAPELRLRLGRRPARGGALALDRRRRRAARRRLARHAAFFDRAIRAPHAALDGERPLVDIFINCSRATLERTPRARLGSAARGRARHARRRHLHLCERADASRTSGRS